MVQINICGCSETSELKELEKRIMSAFDDLKREIAETRAAVALLGPAVESVAVRVQSIVDQLANSPSAETLAVLASELDGEQTKLQTVMEALAAIAPPVEPPANG